MYSGTITIIFDSLNQEARRIALELSMFGLVDKEGKLSDETYALLPPIFGDDFSLMDSVPNRSSYEPMITGCFFIPYLFTKSTRQAELIPFLEVGRYY